MPAIQSMSHDANGVTIVWSGGTVTLTKAQVLANYAAQPGNAATRRAATLAWAKDQLAAGLGITAAEIYVAFDGTNVGGIAIGPRASAAQLQ